MNYGTAVDVIEREKIRLKMVLILGPFLRNIESERKIDVKITQFILQLSISVITNVSRLIDVSFITI